MSSPESTNYTYVCSLIAMVSCGDVSHAVMYDYDITYGIYTNKHKLAMYCMGYLSDGKR